MEGNEGAELHDLRLAPVFFHLVVERLVQLIGVEEHQVGVAQRAFLGFAKTLAVVFVGEAASSMRVSVKPMARALVERRLAKYLSLAKRANRMRMISLSL